MNILFAEFMVAASALFAGSLPPEQQNALVRKYCAGCHTDAVKNGGLSLEYYDAGAANPALAAMLLSKLNGGAMGAAGLGLPEKGTRDAWFAATTVQAEQAKSWTVIHAAPLLSASIVREVAPRSPGGGTPLYRLIVSCNLSNQQGEIQLAWSPQPQTDRTFSVAADGKTGIPHRLEGREEKMGNGSAGTTGFAAAILNIPLPDETLAVTDLFPGETVVFPLGELDGATRRRLAGCLSTGARERLARKL